MARNNPCDELLTILKTPVPANSDKRRRALEQLIDSMINPYDSKKLLLCLYRKNSLSDYFDRRVAKSTAWDLRIRIIKKHWALLIPTDLKRMYFDFLKYINNDSNYKYHWGEINQKLFESHNKQKVLKEIKLAFELELKKIKEREAKILQSCNPESVQNNINTVENRMHCVIKNTPVDDPYFTNQLLERLCFSFNCDEKFLALGTISAKDTDVSKLLNKPFRDDLTVKLAQWYFYCLSDEEAEDVLPHLTKTGNYYKYIYQLYFGEIEIDDESKTKILNSLSERLKIHVSPPPKKIGIGPHPFEVHLVKERYIDNLFKAIYYTIDRFVFEWTESGKNKSIAADVRRFDFSNQNYFLIEKLDANGKTIEFDSYEEAAKYAKEKGLEDNNPYYYCVYRQNPHNVLLPTIFNIKSTPKIFAIKDDLWLSVFEFANERIENLKKVKSLITSRAPALQFLDPDASPLDGPPGSPKLDPQTKIAAPPTTGTAPQNRGVAPPTVDAPTTGAGPNNRGVAPATVDAPTTGTGPNNQGVAPPTVDAPSTVTAVAGNQKPSEVRPSFANYIELTGHYGKKLEMTKEVHADLLRRSQNSTNAQERRSAAAELQILITYLENPKVKTVKVIPTKGGRGNKGRSPDFFVTYENGKSERIEGTALTAAPQGRVTHEPQTLSPGKQSKGGLRKETLERIPTQKELVAALRRKGKSSRDKKGQLSAELDDIPPGGALTIVIKRADKLNDKEIAGAIKQVEAELDVDVLRIEVITPKKTYIFNRKGNAFELNN